MRPKVAKAVVVVVWWCVGISCVCFAQEKRDEREKPMDRKPLGGDVTIKLHVTDLADHRVRIQGTTNLPTGTELMLSVDERAEGGFHGGSKCSVLADGSFQSELFGPANGLDEGAYVAKVLMPIPRVQPDHVRKIIGENGEKLTGPLVESGKIGITVSASQEFTIGDAQASERQKERAAVRVQQYRDWLNKVVALHKRLQTARPNNSSKDNRDRAKWGQFARDFERELASHEEQLNQIQPFKATLAYITLNPPLDHIGRMFRATTSQDSKNYATASADYARSLKELQKFVGEAEAKIPPDVIGRVNKAGGAVNPEKVTHKITDTQFVFNGKRIEVQLSGRLSKDELRALALQLKNADRKEYDRTLIMYYVPGMEAGVDPKQKTGQAWATTHFNPDLEVRILGTTKEEHERLAKEAAKPAGANVIGRWKDDESAFPGIITFSKEGGKVIKTRTFADGSSGKYELLVRTVKNQVRYVRKDDPGGDYWIITPNGDLACGDAEEGIWATSKKIK